MGTKQIEYGEGRVWSFEASVATTSGVLVYIQTGKIRPCTAVSQHVFGVSLIPASAGKQCSVVMEGIVKINTTGTGDCAAGGLIGPTVDGKGVYKAETQLGEHRYMVGYAIETITRNTKGKIKLLW